MYTEFTGSENKCIGDAGKMCEEYFTQYPRDFNAKMLLVNSIRLLKRTRDKVFLIDIYRLIANTKQSKEMVQAILDPNQLIDCSDKLAENIEIDQCFMSYLDEDSSLFRELSQFRAYIYLISH